MKKRVKEINRTVSIAVALSCVASPFSAVSAAGFSTELIHTDAIAEEVLLSNNTAYADELLYNYMLTQSGVTPRSDEARNGMTVCYESGVSARSNLAGIDADVYDYVKPIIQEIAAGTRKSTEIEIPLSIFGVNEGPWTSADLGVPIVSNGKINDDAVEALQAKIEYNSRAVIMALFADLPYDFYWCRKTSYYTSLPGMSARGQNGEYVLYLSGNPGITFYAANDYAGESSTTVTDNLSRVSAAISNAQDIVDANSDKHGLELLDAYRQAICDATEYNNAAANGAAYGDPWQLIYVFDGDYSTKVVCEGYAKAFKYLCDLSADRLPNISCLIATGTTSGPHMWNVVNMDDNRSYLVDLTNGDGKPSQVTEFKDMYFMNIPSSGTYSTGYEFSFPGGSYTSGGYIYSYSPFTLTYTYDNDTLGAYDSRYLKLSTSAYSAPTYTFVPAVEATCDTDGNIAHYIDASGRCYILNNGRYIEVLSSEVVIPATGHDWTGPIYIWSGSTSVTASRTCTKNSNHFEIEEAPVSITVTKQPTCTEWGERTYTAEFSNPAFQKQEKTFANIRSLGHIYGEPEYAWSSDGSSCTATVRCTRSGCNDVITESAAISSEVLTPADYTTKGWTRYTATFSDPHFSSQTKDVQDIPVLVGTDVVIEVIDVNGFSTRTTVCAETFTGFDLPDGKYIDGYTFIGWDINGVLYAHESDAQAALATQVYAKPAEPVKVTLSYEKNNASYRMSVTGGKLSNGNTKGKAQVSNLITVYADAPASGKKFSHWLRNGVKVSTNSTYSFYMPSFDVSLEAVYVNSTSTVSKTGTAIIESVTPNAGTGKVSFVAVLNIPDGCTMVKGGLLATNNASIGTNVNEANAGYVKLSTKVTANTKNLKYTWTKSGVTSNTMWYVRGYLVYKDSLGIEHTVYSDCVKANINGIVD